MVGALPRLAITEGYERGEEKRREEKRREATRALWKVNAVQDAYQTFHNGCCSSVHSGTHGKYIDVQNTGRMTYDV